LHLFWSISSNIAVVTSLHEVHASLELIMHHHDQLPQIFKL